MKQVRFLLISYSLCRIDKQTKQIAFIHLDLIFMTFDNSRAFRGRWHPATPPPALTTKIDHENVTRGAYCTFVLTGHPVTETFRTQGTSDLHTWVRNVLSPTCSVTLVLPRYVRPVTTKTVVTCKIKHLQKCVRSVDFPWLCRGRKNVGKMFYFTCNHLLSSTCQWRI